MPGYVYKGRTYTPGELIEKLIGEREASPGARAMDTEKVLDQIAEANCIDRDLVGSDSFPQRIV